MSLVAFSQGSMILSSRDTPALGSCAELHTHKSPRNYLPDLLRADIWHGPHQAQVEGQLLDAPLGVILSHARVCMNFLYKGKISAAPCPALPCIALWFACERAFLVALGVTLCHARTCMNYPCKGTVVAAPCPALPCIALWFTCERVHCE